MTFSESLVAQAYRELGETKCAACGKSKEPKKSFCASCYFSLPKQMQKSLYSVQPSQYASNYDAAKDWLRLEL